jgi:hypothetical protein
VGEEDKATKMKGVWRWGRSIGGDVEMTSELSSLFVFTPTIQPDFVRRNSAPCQKDSFTKVTQSFVQSAESRRAHEIREDVLRNGGGRGRHACKMWRNLLETGHLENRGHWGITSKWN